MPVIVTRRTVCRLCGSSDLRLALHLTPTPLADGYITAAELDEPQLSYDLDLFLCETCGFLQLLEIVSPEGIYVDYIYETTSSLGLARHFQRYANQILDHIMPEPDALIVDLGSNDGTLLRAFKERGMRVLGIDPAREIARQATEAGIETLPLFFNGSTAPQVLADYGHAAIITCNNLFANIDQLDDVTDGIHHLLRPDGVFIFESFYLVDFVQNMVFDFAYHEHLSYFSVTPLVPFFKRHHLELIDVQRVSTKGGSLRYTVQIEGGPRSVSPAVTNLLDLEAKIGTVHQKIYQKFAVQINAAKNELLKLLDQIQAEGNTLAGYGASATTTTLLYHFGLTDRLAFIADDYPAKQHRYSPGKHIPVLAPEALYEKKPDYVVIMAWRYVEPIVAKHQEYLAQGGKFIVPLPELKVIEKGH